MRARVLEMVRRLALLSASCMVGVLVASSVASAANIVRFDATFAGVGTGTATLSLIADLDLITNDGASFEGGCGPCSAPIAPGWISELTLIVTGAISGNGTYALADFSDVWLDLDPANPVDFGTDLLTQPGFDDFGFFAVNRDTTPTSSGPLVFSLPPGGAGTQTLTSLVATPPLAATPPTSVVEPGSLSVIVSGLIMTFAIRRRRPRS